MAPSLRGIHRRPAAALRLRTLLARRPAAKYEGTLHIEFAANDVKEHWPIVGYPEYSVVRLPPAKQVSSWRGFFGIEYAIRKRQLQQRRRSDRPEFGTCLGLQKERNGCDRSRYDLAVRLSSQTNRVPDHCYFHRLVGISLLYCHWDDNGDLLAVPYRVTAATLEDHEVHHLRGWHRASLKFFAVVPKQLHRKLNSGQVRRLPMPPGGVSKVAATRVI